MIRDCKAHGYGSVAIEIGGADGITFSNIVTHGAIHIQNSNDNKFNGTKVNSFSTSPRLPKIGRNEPCPCGSQKKYKRCHGGVNMAKGIISRNSSTTFNDTEINTDGVGIDLDHDKSTFNGLNINAFDNPELFKLVKEAGLPANPPGDLIEEAYLEVQKTGDASPLEGSKLKRWFLEQDLTGAFWADFSVKLANLALVAKSAGL
ncbi:hypothetical protein D3C77_415410 [compost metagenome]